MRLANGAPAESYRDDGNRWLFHNPNSGWEKAAPPPCATVLTGGPGVDAVWRRLLDRAGPRPAMPLTDDPGLHLIVDGVRVDIRKRRGPTYVFRLPTSASRIVIASNEAVPSELRIARDHRSLGVAVRRVTLRQGGRSIRLDANDQRLTAGFHGYQADDRLRWTDGRTALPEAGFGGLAPGAEVTLHLGGTMRYPEEGSPQVSGLGLCQPSTTFLRAAS